MKTIVKYIAVDLTEGSVGQQFQRLSDALQKELNDNWQLVHVEEVGKVKGLFFKRDEL